MSGRISILVQLIVGFSLIALCIIPITGYITYQVSEEQLLKQSTQYLEDSVASVRETIDNELRNLDRISQQTAVHPDIQSYLRSMKRQEPSFYSRQEIVDLLSRQSRYGGNSFIMQVVDMKDELIRSHVYLSLLWSTKAAFEEEPWYRDVLALSGGIRWFGGQAWHNGRIPTVIGVRQINGTTNLSRLGDIFVSIPVSDLVNISLKSNEDFIVRLYVVDYLGNIVYAFDQAEIGQPLERSLPGLVRSGTEGFGSYRLDERDYHVAYSSSNYSGLSTLAFIEPSTVVKEMQQTRYVTMYAVAAGTLLSILMVIFFSWTITKPIRLLSFKLNRVRNDKLSILRDKQANKELQQLVDSYNLMIEQLNGTIEKLSEAKVSQQEARIVAWKAQFRPHFMYNTLNTIYWVLSNDGHERSAEMVLQLSELLRYSIQPGSETVTLREDLLQLERYLNLQKMRYGDVLHFRIEVPEELRERKVMKMLLQPLVENAITHGLEPVFERNWQLEIRCHATDEGLQLVVADNGIGMTPEAIDAFHRNEPLQDVQDSKQTQSGLGLANLRNRLGYYYGTAYYLRLAPAEAGGLVVTLELPFVEHRAERRPDTGRLDTDGGGEAL